MINLRSQLKLEQSLAYKLEKRILSRIARRLGKYLMFDFLSQTWSYSIHVVILKLSWEMMLEGKRE